MRKEIQNFSFNYILTCLLDPLGQFQNVLNSFRMTNWVIDYIEFQVIIKLFKI